jgi:structural maintenance of chromosome 1
MGLERVEVENFKSYSGRQTIGPFDRFSCIVGPNGSGKSNIMDAITFCLGIGSSHLRTESARALIHRNCTFASVTLHMLHGDKRYVVARHISDSGRSQYYLEEKRASYDEFREFLESINILIRVRNFLVFQGDINSIANMMPGDLVRLFEEMSGSNELKESYEEALRKQGRALSECSSLFEERKELLAKIREAKEVKEQEKTFRKLVESRTAVQGKLLLHRLYEKRHQIAEMGRQAAELEAQELSIQSLIGAKEREMERAKSRASDAQKEYFESENDVLRCTEKISEAKRLHLEAEQGKDKHRIRMLELEKEAREHEETGERRRSELRRIEKELEAVEYGYSTICQQEEERRMKLQGEDASWGEIERREKEYLLHTVRDQEMLDVLDLELFPKETRKEALAEKAALLKCKMEQLRTALSEKELLRKSTEAKVLALERSTGDVRRRIEGSEARYEKLIESEREKNNQLSALLVQILGCKGQRRIDARRSLIQSTLECLKAIFPGVHGRVVDLVKPTQQKFELPLSVLLGTHDQSVIVDSENTAVSCINYMKDKKLCKITFLPLQNLEVGEADASLRQRGRLAIDTLVYDPRYKRAVMYLFRDSMIADTFDTAKDLVYGQGLKVNVCTLDGVYLHGRGHFITGGGSRGNMFKETELDKLIKRRADVLGELREIQEAKTALSHVEIARERLLVWGEARDKEVGLLSEIDRDANDIQARIRSNQEQQELVEAEQRSIDAELGESRRRVEELRSRMSEAEARIFGDLLVRAGFRDYGEYKDVRDSNLFVKKTFEYESVKHKLLHKAELLKEEINSLSDKLREMRQEGLEGSEQSLPDLNELVARLAEAEDSRKEKSNVFERAKQELQGVNGEYRDLALRRNELDQHLVSAASLRSRLEEEIKDAISFAMLEEIEVPYTDTGEVDFSHLSGTPEELGRELETINAKINEQVPLIKTEVRSSDQSRYMKVSAEYERRKELAMRAREEFNEVRGRRTRCFMECFEKVSKEIGRVYKALTMTESAEGGAYLVLENSTEPFAEGIKFHTMPPNKRLREVRLLSGGEKTMAVLALLLSFHAFRPAPFYIFDEIDSALDKNNVSRIIEFMLGCDVQFVIISLKPMLFQHSDSLIGVYKDPTEHASRILTYRFD